MLCHFVFESLAYAVAFRLYVRLREEGGDFLDANSRWSLIVAAIAGAAVGSRLLFWLEDPLQTWQHAGDLRYLLSGKTIIGALLGGTAAVEWIKRRKGIRRRTGDLFAIPLAAGIAIGRIGCLLAGKQDDTYGIPTILPWGIDLGDGIRRHPVQLYEVACMLLLLPLVARVRGPRFAEGDRFRLFLLAYLTWRLLVDFLKPGVRFCGLTMLQWTCVAGAIWYFADLRRIWNSYLASRKAAVSG